MATIQDYKVSSGQTECDALWASGVYYKEEDATFYHSAYLVNGRCRNCNGTHPDHPPHCPGAKMKTIINLVYPMCVVCKYNLVEEGVQVCHACEADAEVCSCCTPECCERPDEHDKNYYAAKRAEWKAKLAVLGIKTD